MSATSGKAGGLTKGQRLKAAWSFGRHFRASVPMSVGIRRSSPRLCVADNAEPRPTREIERRPTFKAIPRPHSIHGAPPDGRLPEPSNFGSLSGRAGGFPNRLKDGKTKLYVSNNHLSDFMQCVRER